MKRVFGFIRRLFSAKSLIAEESILGLLIAFAAFAVAAVSLVHSRQANQTAQAANALAEENNRINKRALVLSEQSAAAKGEITLSAMVSNDTLTLKPTSAEFVLSDSQIEYARLFAERVVNKTKPLASDKEPQWMIAQPVTEETDTAGVHSLTFFKLALEEVILSSEQKHKWRTKLKWNYDTFDIAGYFPILIRVDYVFEGHAAPAAMLYEIFYSGMPEIDDGEGITLGKPRLVRRLDRTEDPRAVLIERFDQWHRENFTSHRVPELASPMPAPSPASKKKPQSKKRN